MLELIKGDYIMRTEKDRLTDTAIANKRRYDNEYLLTNYKNFVVHIPKDEYELYEEILKKLHLTKVQFIRIVFKMVENGELVIKKDE